MYLYFNFEWVPTLQYYHIMVQISYVTICTISDTGINIHFHPY